MKDLIILGNGMAGMTAALYAKRANLNFKIVGQSEYDFGQIGEVILVENYPCVGTINGFDLAMKLHDQLEDNGIKIEEHTINNIQQLSDKSFSIYYDDGIVDLTKSVIYALGASHRKLECEINDKVILHYCALCDGPLYKDKGVVVIGGGDVAFTEAEYLSKICKNVTILMCDSNVTAAPSIFERISKIENIKIVYNFPITSINKNSNNIYILGSKGIRGFYIADGIFVAIGMIPNIKPVENIIPLHEGYIDCWDESLQSIYIQGLFAAGDVRLKAVRQSITAAADGAIAVNSVINYLKTLE